MVAQKSISWSWMDDSHPFHSMSVGHPIPGIRLFQTLTLKLEGQCHGLVKGQGHAVGPVSYLFASFSLHINQTNNSRDTAISKFDHEKSKVMSEVKGQGHIAYTASNWCSSFLFHIKPNNHSRDMAKRSVWTWNFFKENSPKSSFPQNFSKIWLCNKHD